MALSMCPATSRCPLPAIGKRIIGPYNARKLHKGKTEWRGGEIRMKSRKVLLFDIDATLLKTGHAGLRALDRVFQELYQVSQATKGLRPAGKTDPLIIRELLEGNVPNLDPVSEMPRVVELYVEYLGQEVEVSPGFEVMTGVPELLETLSRIPRIVLGLATGNLEEGAYIKLRRAGLGSYFSFGGFGGDSENRTEVVLAAIRRARDHLKQEVPLDTVYVIGDTPRDIVHAKEAGVLTVAVATGSSDAEELSRYDPDYLFEDFSETNRVVEVFSPGVMRDLRPTGSRSEPERP
jgi:phosphoglycolate phosphatase-like HAD superfamily hydrolase